MNETILNNTVFVSTQVSLSTFCSHKYTIRKPIQQRFFYSFNLDQHFYRELKNVFIHINLQRLHGMLPFGQVHKQSRGRLPTTFGIVHKLNY